MITFFQYVLKKMNLSRASKRERTSAEQEAKLLSKLKHPNIVSYKDSFETREGYLYIAMQYCEGGDLYTKLKEQKCVLLDERQVVEWFVQIAMAMQVRFLFFYCNIEVLLSENFLSSWHPTHGDSWLESCRIGSQVVVRGNKMDQVARPLGY